MFTSGLPDIFSLISLPSYIAHYPISASLFDLWLQAFTVLSSSRSMGEFATALPLQCSHSKSLCACPHNSFHSLTHLVCVVIVIPILSLGVVCVCVCLTVLLFFFGPFILKLTADKAQWLNISLLIFDCCND